MSSSSCSPERERGGGRGAATAAAVLALLTFFPSCSAPGSSELVVFAAASLTEAFRDVGEEFEERDPAVTVLFNFGPSDGLATQIIEAAPADVFASASPRWMDAVARAVGVEMRADLSRNRLAVLVPAGNPAALTRFDDVARPGVKLVLGAPGVPVGDYARAALGKAGILRPALDNLVSNEEDAKGVVQKIVLGEADAGIAYVTDVSGGVRPHVEVLEIPEHVNVPAIYEIAALRGSERPGPARAFVAFVLGPQGQRLLRARGFLSPP